MMSSPDHDNDTRTIYLDELNVDGTRKRKFRIKLHVNDVGIDLVGGTTRWTPSRNPEVGGACNISIVMKAGGFLLPKQEMTIDISSEKVIEEFLKTSGQCVTQGSSTEPKHRFSISENVTFDGQSVTVTLKFHPSPTSESTREALDRVEVAMGKFKQLKTNKLMQATDSALKFGFAASEVEPYAKAAFAIAKAAFDLLKEQQKYDGMVSGLVERIARILPFSERVEETSCDDADLLKEAIEKMNNLIVDTAEFACGYVQQSFMKRLAKSTVSPTDRRMIEELQVRMSDLVEDFDRAVEVETLKTTRAIDEKLLLEKLRPVQTGYDSKRDCMKGTRQEIIKNIMGWVRESPTDDPSQEQATTTNVFWLYGMPGLGKTSVANSLCSLLHQEGKLGGSFFCRRDDPNLSSPKYVIPTLTCQLAETWAPFRKNVAEALRKDPKTTPESTGSELLAKVLKSLKHPPPDSLVLVIDALDECGEGKARKSMLKRLFDATSCVSWLKVIITSRQEEDINAFFQQSDRSSRYSSRDLANDDKSDEDIRLFAKKRLSSIGAAVYLAKGWPGEELLGNIASHAQGLFIFVETLWRLVKEELDPDEYLNRALSKTSGDAMGGLYDLYSKAIKPHVGQDKEKFRSIIGAIIVVASHRPLRGNTIAMLLGLPPFVVETLVDKLTSLLYREGGELGGIRVRHLSIIDFLTSSSCPEEFRVDLQRANSKVALSCLNTMIKLLKFNICGLENSLLSNEEVTDMEDRVRKNIPDGLQYSCMHWAGHVSLSPYFVNSETFEKLDKFFEDMQPLYWIEALSVMGKVSIGIQMLRQVISWFKGPKVPLLECIDDALRFLLAFRTPITTSTPHIYISGLPFTPTESILWKKASGSFQRLMKVRKGRMERWLARPITWAAHTGPVWSISYSPDGRHVVSGSGDNTIRIWDADTGAPVGEPLKGHSEAVYSVAYSPDGRHVVSGSEDNTIRIWDADTGAPVGEPLKGHSEAVYSVAYSPDGRHVVSGSEDNTIRIWDADTGAPVGEPLNGHSRGVSSVAYSPDGRHVVSGSEDNTIRIWDADTGAPVGEPLNGHSRGVSSVAYSPDGRHVVSGSHDNTIRIWDADTGAPVGEPLNGHSRGVSSVAYSPDGRHVVSGSYDNTIRIWDADTGAPVGKPLKGHSEAVYSVAYSPDGRHVVSGSYDNTIRIWDADTGAPVGEPLKGHSEAVYSVAYSPDGRHVVSGSEDNTIRIWDADTGAPVGEPLNGHSRGVSSVAYSPDGRHVVSGSYDNTIRIWDADTGAPVGKPLKGHSEAVYSVAYSPDGRHVVSGSGDNTIRIWDADTGAPVGEPLKGHSEAVYSVAYSPDGRHVVSGSEDNTIRIWDADTGAPVGEPLKGHSEAVYSVAYSPDGRHVVSGSHDNTIRIWDADTGAPVGEPFKGHSDADYSAAYSPDGRHVVSGSHDNTIRIWNADTGAPVAEALKVHTSSVKSVAYSPDDRHTGPSSKDTTIRNSDITVMVANDSPASVPTQTHDTPSSIVAISPDIFAGPDGWVRHGDGGLLLWIPEGYRKGLVCPAIVIISPSGHNQACKVDFSQSSFGIAWAQVKVASKTTDN